MKAITYSLYGNEDVYIRGVMENCELAKRLYPGWEVHVYTDGTTKQDALDAIADLGGHVHQVKWDNPNGVFLRMKVGEIADVFICRDADSRLSAREVAAVDEWLASERPYHLMHDHHWHRSPVMAGMWGAHSSELPKWFLPGLYTELGLSVYDDQRYLTKNLWGVLLMHHPERYMHHWGNGWRSGYEIPFPTKRYGREHIGDSYLRPNGITIIDKPCPPFVYLVQTNKNVSDLPFTVPDDADLIVLQWEEGLDPGEHGFYFPSAWAAGTNELFHRAWTGKMSYQYFMSMDDDVRMDFDLSEFQDMLLKYRPIRATPVCHIHNSKVHPFYRDIPQCCQIKYCENMLVAYRRDAAQALMPYTTKYDKTNWWMGCEDMCDRFHEKYGVATSVFGSMHIYNMESREYPREGYTGLPEQEWVDAPERLVKAVEAHDKAAERQRTGIQCHCDGDEHYHAGKIEQAIELWRRGAALGHEQCRKNLKWVKEAKNDH